jgi:hypothetical protein
MQARMARRNASPFCGTGKTFAWPPRDIPRSFFVVKILFRRRKVMAKKRQCFCKIKFNEAATISLAHVRTAALGCHPPGTKKSEKWCDNGRISRWETNRGISSMKRGVRLVQKLKLSTGSSLQEAENKMVAAPFLLGIR